MEQIKLDKNRIKNGVAILAIFGSFVYIPLGALIALIISIYLYKHREYDHTTAVIALAVSSAVLIGTLIITPLSIAMK